MAFFIVKNFNNKFLTNRKATDIMYESRSGWSYELDDAKVFSTQGAATRSGTDNGQCDFQVVQVELIFKQIVKTVQI